MPAAGFILPTVPTTGMDVVVVSVVSLEVKAMIEWAINNNLLNKFCVHCVKCKYGKLIVPVILMLAVLGYLQSLEFKTTKTPFHPTLKVFIM